MNSHSNPVTFFVKTELNLRAAEALALQNNKEDVMKKLLFGIAAAGALFVAAPASAQVYFGADPGGVGVQVGPVGAGVGPRYMDDGRYQHRRAYRDSYAYGGDCRTIRSRAVTPSGREVIRTRRVCD